MIRQGIATQLSDIDLAKAAVLYRRTVQHRTQNTPARSLLRSFTLAPVTLDRAVARVIDGVESMTNRRLRPYQRRLTVRLIQSILLNEGRAFTVLWARQIGKTEWGQMILLGLMVLMPELAKDARMRHDFPILVEYEPGFLVGFVAPKLDTARIPFRRLRTLVKTPHVRTWLADLDIRVDVANNNGLALTNGSSAMALSGAPTSFQEGFTFHFLWIEETQKVAQYQLRKVFEPMLAATNGTMVEVGTGGTKRCAFLEDIETNKRNAPEDHSQINWRQVIEIMRAECPGDPWADRYEKHVQRTIQRATAGEMSESFRMNYLLEWILTHSQLVNWDVWQLMRGDFQRGTFTAGKQRVFGIDVGKVNDPSVVTAGEVWDDHVRWIDWLELLGTDYEDQADIIAPWVTSRGADDPSLYSTLVVDSTGVGDPVTDMFRHRLRSVHGLKYTAQSKDGLYKRWASRIPMLKEDGTLKRGCGVLYADCDPEDLEFRKFELQFLNCEVEQKGDLVAYHHPEADDDEGGELLHDDYVDSGFNVLFGADLPAGRFTTATVTSAAATNQPAQPVSSAAALQSMASRQIREAILR